MSSDSSSQYEVTVRTPLLTANSQRRLHFHVWSKITGEARQSAYVLVKQAKVPRCTKVRLAFFPGQAKGKLADPGAHFPIAKAVEDGLVDAGVIPDDSGTYVERIAFYAPERTEVDQLRMVIVPLDIRPTS